MTINQPSLLTRDDTFFGVCQGLGEDLGINPNFLRIVLALLLFWTPVGAICTYLVAGLIVAVTRWMAPDRIAAERPRQDAVAVESEANQEPESLAIAA